MDEYTYIVNRRYRVCHRSDNRVLQKCVEKYLAGFAHIYLSAGLQQSFWRKIGLVVNHNKISLLDKLSCFGLDISRRHFRANRLEEFSQVNRVRCLRIQIVLQNKLVEFVVSIFLEVLFRQTIQ